MQTPELQTIGAQQSSAFKQLSPAARHVQVPPVQAIVPQHSSSLEHRLPAIEQHALPPAADSSHASGKQHSSWLVQADVMGLHMPPSGTGGGGGGGGGGVSTQSGASATTAEQSRRRVLRSFPSTQRRSPHASV